MLRAPSRALLLVFLVACDADAPSPATAPGAAPTSVPASIPLSDWQGATLTVLSEGGEPKELLSIPIDQPAAPATVEWDSTFRTSATRGAVTTDPAVIRQVRTLAIQVAPGSPATFDFQVTAARDEASAGPPVDGSVASALEGRAGRWTSGPACDVQQAGIDSSDAGPAEPHLPGLLRTAVEYCPRLPDIPVGVGARWTTTERGGSGGPVTMEWVLVQRDAQQVSLTFQTTADSAAHGSLADGRVSLDRHHPVPVRFDATGRTTRERPDPDRPGQTLLWTTAWEMHAVRTLGTGE